MKAPLVVLISIGALALSAGAQNTNTSPAVVRSAPEKHDQSGVANKEIVTGTATFPVGSSIGFHTHPGDEAGFVAKGSIILKTRGQTDRIVTAGESFFNVRGAVHSVVAGPEGATVVSTWIVDKGVPLATPVP
jgi:quercetin dioxygenase-like cupin family protein